MMFCKFCGTQISDNAVFCEKCGKRLDDAMGYPQQEAVAPAGAQYDVPDRQPGDRGEYVASAKYSASSQIVSIVFGIIGLMFGIALVAWSSSLKWYDKMYSDKDMIQTVGVIIIIAWIIGFICDLVVINANSKIQCTAYENMVIGTGSLSRWGFSTMDFRLYYHQIDSVTANNRIIKIRRSNGTEYIIAASSNEEANQLERAINRRISKIRGGNTGSYVVGSDRVSVNEWRCPNCGRVNQNDVGTCGCGIAKPSNGNKLKEGPNLKTCDLCDKQVVNTYYVKINDDYGTRYRYVCEDCMRKHHYPQVE